MASADEEAYAPYPKGSVAAYRLRVAQDQLGLQLRCTKGDLLAPIAQAVVDLHFHRFICSVGIPKDFLLGLDDPLFSPT